MDASTGREDGFGEKQILRRGELYVGLLAPYHKDPASGPLDEGGVVGCGAEVLPGTQTDLAVETESESLRGLGGVKLRPVEGIQYETVPGDLDGIRDGERGNDSVHATVSRERRHDACDEVRGDEAARPIVNQNKGLFFFSTTEPQAVVGRERADLTGRGATSVLAYSRLRDEILDEALVSDGVDPGYIRCLFEGA